MSKIHSATGYIIVSTAAKPPFATGIKVMSENETTASQEV